jgi:hypothetical protein
VVTLISFDAYQSANGIAREFQIYVVCGWLGNSPRIAQQSFLQVTEDDFAKAAGSNVMEPSAPLLPNS